MPRDVPSQLWVQALMRRAQIAGAFATIVHRGDADRGDVLVKVRDERGAAWAYAPAFAGGDAAEFERLPPGVERPEEKDVDELIQKRLKYDRDLWVVEIEDRDGRHFLTEKVR